MTRRTRDVVQSIRVDPASFEGATLIFEMSDRVLSIPLTKAERLKMAYDLQYPKRQIKVVLE